MKKRRFVVSAAALTLCAGMAQAQFVESFDNVLGGPFPTAFAPAGWTGQNNSSPGLTNWFPGNAAVFAQFEGSGYLGTNFNNTSGTNTISNWMISPITTLTNGAQFKFYTRTVDAPAFPDRLQVRMNKVNAGANVGSGATDVGDFTDLLLDINPSYGLVEYPTAWTQYTVTVSGVTGSVAGRLALRYFVESGGPTGANSDYIGVDAAEYTVTGAITGACCIGAPVYSCGLVTQAACLASGGTYAGDGVTCAVANCAPPPSGACCLPSGCSVLTQAACTAQGGTYAGNSVTCVAANCPPPSIWTEIGEAGETPGTEQVVLGNGPLSGINGTLGAGDSDMYQINICDETNFSATTVGSTTFDTQLWLFNTSGIGVTFNDDSTGLQSTLTSTFVSASGIYILAISQYDRDANDSGGLALWIDTPFGVERIPDGPGAANAVASWDGAPAGGSYSIGLTGTCFVGGTVGACCLGAPSYSCVVSTQANCTTQGGTYAGNGVSCAAANCPPPPTGRCCSYDGTCSVITAAACSAAGGVYGGNATTCGTCPQPYTESGDAGDLPGTAAVVAGSGTLPAIIGTLGASDTDMYRFRVCDAANFLATTRNLSTVDTQLFIFKTDGTGVVVNDDTAPGGLGLQSTITSLLVGPAGNGEYYLGVSQYDRDPLGVTGGLELWLDLPFGSERAPDGPNAAEAVGSWFTIVGTGGSYAVRMNGACYVGTSCYANCDGVGGLTANDFICFVTAYNQALPYANCDGVGGLTANDFICFVTAYNTGCS